VRVRACHPGCCLQHGYKGPGALPLRAVRAAGGSPRPLTGIPGAHQTVQAAPAELRKEHEDTKVALWNELKVAVFTEMLASVYTLALLTTFVRVQLNILGGYAVNMAPIRLGIALRAAAQPPFGPQPFAATPPMPLVHVALAAPSLRARARRSRVRYVRVRAGISTRVTRSWRAKRRRTTRGAWAAPQHRANAPSLTCCRCCAALAPAPVWWGGARHADVDHPSTVKHLKLCLWCTS
jgi:hypothetical protein